MKLKEWAEKTGVKYLTAYRWFKSGTLPVKAYQTDSGTIIVEDNFSEQTMNSNTSNDAVSLFLKKTVEFSKNNSTVEDFAAYVISNFQLKINSVLESPKYSKQKPKSEEVQKHFQQFIPKGEKPKTNSFVMEPEVYQDIAPTIYPTNSDSDFNSQDLVKEFSKAITHGSLNDTFTGSPTSAFDGASVSDAGAMSPTENSVTRSVDSNTTPQSINYTGSNNPIFSGSLTSNGVFVTNSSSVSGIDTVASYMPNSSGLYFTSMTSDPDPTGTILSTEYIGSFQPTQKELQLVKTSGDIKLNQPRAKRGRKPNKR